MGLTLDEISDSTLEVLHHIQQLYLSFHYVDRVETFDHEQLHSKVKLILSIFHTLELWCNSNDEIYCPDSLKVIKSELKKLKSHSFDFIKEFYTKKYEVCNTQIAYIKKSAETIVDIAKSIQSIHKNRSNEINVDNNHNQISLRKAMKEIISFLIYYDKTIIEELGKDAYCNIDFKLLMTNIVKFKKMVEIVENLLKELYNSYRLSEFKNSSCTILKDLLTLIRSIKTNSLTNKKELISSLQISIRDYSKLIKDIYYNVDSNNYSLDEESPRQYETTQVKEFCNKEKCFMKESKQDSSDTIVKSSKKTHLLYDSNEQFDDDSLWLITDQNILVCDIEKLDGSCKYYQKYMLKSSLSQSDKTLGHKSLKSSLKKLLTKSKGNNLSLTDDSISQESKRANHKRSNTDHILYRSHSFSTNAKEINSKLNKRQASQGSMTVNNDNSIEKENINGKNNATYVTLTEIIEKLTDPDSNDKDFIKNFLLTFRIFICPITLLDLLESRWHLAKKESSTDENILFSIRLCVYNVIKSWIETNFHDFEDESCKLKLKSIIDLMNKNGMTSAASNLENLLNMKEKVNQSGCYNFSDSNFPSPIYPLSFDSIRDFHPKELARQLSLIEYDLYRSIKPYELLEANWTKKDKEAKSPNVLKMINFSNHVINWIIHEVLIQENCRARALVMNRLIFVAKYLKEMNNLNGAMEILSGLKSSSIFRLKETWRLIPKETWKIFEDLDTFFDSEANFRNYRVYINSISPPCIPYLGRHLSDLLFLDEKYPKVVEGKMNYSKMEAIGSIISFLRSLHHIPYHFVPLDKVIRYIESGKEMDDKEGYKRSLQLEKR